MRMSTIQVGGFWALVLSALMLAGCATVNVSSYVEGGTDIPRYHTFGWDQTDTLSTGDPRLDNNRFFDERVRAQIEKGLVGRGFNKIASGTPDLLVHYHVFVTQEIDVRNFDREYTYCADADCRPFIYDAGTLFVDLVDPLTNKVVWRGWAEGSVEGVIDNQGSMEVRVDEVVARILERLPRRL